MNATNQFTANLIESLRPIFSDRELSAVFKVHPSTIQSWLGKRPGYIHGMGQTSEYNSWRGMIRRCASPTSHNYRWYGARGITVCDRWKDFRKFFEDMGKKPFVKATIERIDNSKPVALLDDYLIRAWAEPKALNLEKRERWLRGKINFSQTECAIV